MEIMRLSCQHSFKKVKLKFLCEITEDYELLLCENCYKNEDLRFLIYEEEIS